jgi:predicted membrane protein
MTVAGEAALSPSHHYWLRSGLMLVAVLELLDAVPSLSHLTALSQSARPLVHLSQALLDVKLILSPLAASAALIFAFAGRLRRSVLALAAFAFMGWALDDVWQVAIHGVGFRPDYYYGQVDAFAHQMLFPLGAFLGAGLALRTRHLAWAGLFSALPPLFNWANVILFAVSVILYS